MKPPAPIPALPVPAGGAHTIAVRVDGDPVALQATTAWLTGIAGAAGALADDMATTVTASQHIWTGPAADTFRDRVRRGRDHADGLRHALSAIVSAVDTFAEEIRAVKLQMAAAKELARSVGCRVTADSIQFPLPLLNPAQGGTSGEVTAMVGLARRRESAAHTALRAALARHKSFLESLTSSPTRAVSVSRSLFMEASKAKAYTETALTHAKALSSAAFIAENADGGLRQAAQAELFGGASAGMFDQAVRGSRSALGYGAPNWVTPPAGDFAKKLVGPALKPLTVSSGMLAGAGVGLDIMSGTPADKAVVKGGASFAAGAATSAALEAGGLILLGASPPGLVLIAASVIVSAGVGYSIDQAWRPTPPDANAHGGGW
ncbi:WXG100 family type VII secretion target [Amycolatopsis sp. NPDC003861]